MMPFPRYVKSFRARARGAEVSVVSDLHEPGGPYPLLRLRTPGRVTLLLTAGFHGEEPAGPMTLLEHLGEILAYAGARDVGLLLYPCINPSGFEDGSRYNRSGEKPNNDFMRYEVAPGQWKGELRPDEDFLRWELAEGGPKETQALRADLAGHDVPLAALDLHQDRWVRQPHVYAYVQKDRADYLPMIRASGEVLPPMREATLDELYSTDEHGLTYGPDGSITDYAARRGARWAATLETTTVSPLEACHQVNLRWIFGFLDLVANAGR